MANLLVLPNVYCSPNDIFDYVGQEGVELRLDDHLQATGQVIQVTADAAQSATTLVIAPLIFPLIKGTVLNFDGGGMATVVQAVLSATALVGASTLAVNAILGPIAKQAQAADSGVNLALSQRLIKACQIGTVEVKRWCTGRYNDSDLATAWSPNIWATYSGAKWLCSRRGNIPPGSVMADYEQALQEMKMVRVGQLAVEGIGTRTAGWPFMSNVTIDLAYTYRKVRVEQSISEGTPTQYPQPIDWGAAFLLEY